MPGLRWEAGGLHQEAGKTSLPPPTDTGAQQGTNPASHCLAILWAAQPQQKGHWDSFKLRHPAGQQGWGGGKGEA